MKTITAIFLMLILPLQVHADGAELVSDEQQIEQVFAKYMQGYNSYLQTKVMNKELGLYTDSMMLITPNRSPAILDEAKLAVGIQSFLDRLSQKGVSKIAWDKLQIKLLSPSVAIASNAAIRYKSNGEVHDHAGATYMLTKDKEQWKIAAFTPHPAENALALN